jgi:penicillin-binding protein 2
MKLIAAALTLEQGKVSKKWIVNCSGAYTLGDRTFHCWNAGGHGIVNMKQAITHSCNIYFYQLIQKLSFADWKEMAENFGYGHLSGIDLYGEVTGNIPGREYMNKKYGKYGWATGNLLTFVIGQGDILVTPIQVVQMMNLIASRGNTHAPGLNINNSSNKFNLHLKSSTWDFLQDAIWNVVNKKDGTGKLAKIEGADIHGKTGTAQNPHGEDHSWFTGYMAIDNNPVISLVVLVEHGGKGSIKGAVISRKIFEFVLQNELIH